MDLIFNDLSIHEQFHNPSDLQKAFLQINKLRNVAKNYQRVVKCSSSMPYERLPVPGVPFHKAINTIPDKNLKRAILSWLTRDGPFWGEFSRHSSSDWFECRNGSIVTDTGVGEAAFRVLNDEDCGLISVSPSDWIYDPIPVKWIESEAATTTKEVSVENWWTVDQLENYLAEREAPISSWHKLASLSRSRFHGLKFFKKSFAPLFELPFSGSASDQIFRLLKTLNSLVQAQDADGRRTQEGHEIYKNFFVGERARFSDSSDREKQRFREELKFSDRDFEISRLSCPWHGKVNYTTPIRLHFSWPIRAGEPLYIAYIGPKITMR